MDAHELSKLNEWKMRQEKKLNPIKPKFMFAVVSRDEVGQTINLFKTKKQAEMFLDQLCKKS